LPGGPALRIGCVFCRRIPGSQIHPLEQHLSISAAIADALPKPAFLIFSLGPVQEFIAAARRTQDLWMGSWILSYLSWKAIESLADEFGPDVIVFPSASGAAPM